MGVLPAALEPGEAERPETFLWSDRPKRKPEPWPISLPVLPDTRTVLDTEHKVEWGAGVAAYLVTKGVAAGVAMLAPVVGLFGDAGFAVTCVNAPASSAGIVAKSTRSLTTPINLSGLLIFIDPSAPLWFFAAQSDATGSSAVNLPIPGEPGLVGARLFSQFLWPDACTPIGLSASNALALTFQHSGS